MKKIAFTFIILTSFFLSADLTAQKRIKESDIIGTWKLNIDVDKAMNEAKEDLDEEDNLIGKVLLSSISGFVDNIIEEIDIYLNFKKGGKLEILVNAFDEKEIEYSEWYINNKGELYIEDTDHIKTDNDRFILTSSGILIPVDSDNDPPVVYLVKVDN